MSEANTISNSTEVKSKITEVAELIDQVLDVESVRFTIKMRNKLEKAYLILASLED